MQSATQSASNKQIWTGRVLSALAVLFLIFDGVTKLMRDPYVLQAMVQLEFSEKAIVEIGVVLLVCAALYVIPKTSVFGAVLLTAYLGGAVAAQLRVGKPMFETLFPVFFGIVIWAGLFLREPRLWALIPLRK